MATNLGAFNCPLCKWVVFLSDEPDQWLFIAVHVLCHWKNAINKCPVCGILCLNAYDVRDHLMDLHEKGKLEGHLLASLLIKGATNEN